MFAAPRLMETPEPADVTAVLVVLDRYFKAIESDVADQLQPDPMYIWRFYEGEVTIERWRANLKDLDTYMGEAGQFGYVNGQVPEGTPLYEAGPSLSRLPDAAVWAMYQELDSLLADEKEIHER